jgi:tetratricopeptide (TPR) repeat protein
LKELQAVYDVDNEGYVSFFSDQIDLAKEALERGAREKALLIWREMHALYPDLTMKSEKASNLLIDAGRHEEAEALIHEASKRYPRQKSLYAALFIRVAYRRGDFDEALRRCDAVRRKFPDVVDGYSLAAAALSDMGRPNEAEAMLGRGAQKIPGNFDLSMRYAQAATRRLDWAEGLKRWQVLQHNFEHLPGPLGVAECLRELGRFDEAEQTLIQACERFHMNPWAFAELAKFSTIRRDFDEAVRRWESVLKQFPWFEYAYPAIAEALCDAGREGETDEWLRVGMTRSPGDIVVNLAYARSAHRRKDWVAAAERWAAIREHFPDCDEARLREAEAVAALQQQAAFSDR